MKVNCPQCNTEYEVEESMRGQNFNCTQDGCPGILVIPEKNTLNLNPEAFTILDSMKRAFKGQILCLLLSVIVFVFILVFFCIMIESKNDRNNARYTAISLEIQADETKLKLEQTQDKSGALYEERSRCQKAATKAKNNLKEAEQKLIRLNKEYTDNSETLSSTEKRLREARTRLSNVRNQMEQANKTNKRFQQTHQKKLEEHDDIESRLIGIETQKKKILIEQNNLKSIKPKLESELDRHKNKFDFAKKELNALPSENDVAAAEFNYNEAVAATKPKRIVAAVGASPMSSNYNSATNEKVQTALKEYEKLRTKRQVGLNEFHSAQRAYLDAKHRYEELNETLQNLETEYKDLLSREKKLSEQLKDSERTMSPIAETSKRASFKPEDFESFQNTSLTLEYDIRNFDETISRTASENKKIRRELETVKYRKAHLQEDYQTAEEDLNQASREYKEITQKLDSLKTTYSDQVEGAQKANNDFKNLTKQLENLTILLYICLIVYSVLWLWFLIYHFTFIYQGWHLIPETTAVTTPNKAIWLNFVPGLFPFWQWVTYFELGKAYSDLSGRRANKVFALIVSVMNFLGVWIISLPWIAIILVMQGELLRSAEIIVNNQTEDE